MQAAARAAGLEGLYLLWLKQTDEGMRRRITLEGITDEYGGRLAGIAAQERMYADMGYAPAIVEDDVPPEETDDDT